MTKHPGPWGIESWMTNPPIPSAIIDGQGRPGQMVLHAERDRLVFADDEAKLLILAAPELLEALKRVLDGEPGARSEAKALVAKIEGR